MMRIYLLEQPDLSSFCAKDYDAPNPGTGR